MREKVVMRRKRTLFYRMNEECVDLTWGKACQRVVYTRGSHLVIFFKSHIAPHVGRHEIAVDL